jgi:NodT family efflux transporter outer membrane factor (OMF) lipoprotein
MIRFFVVCVVAAAVGACTAPPARPVAAVVASAADVGLGDEAVPDVAAQWWRDFDDPALTQLIEMAVRNAPSVAAAEAALAHATADLDASRSQQGLALNGSLSEDREHFSARSYVPPPWGGNTYWNGTLGADLRWDLDLYGRIQRRIAAAEQERAARRSQLRGARLMVEAAVATAYIDWIRAVHDVTVAESLVTEREALRTRAQRRTEHGLAPLSEVTVAVADCDAAGAELARDRAEVPLALHRLGLLTGQGERLTALPTPQLNPAALAVPQALPGDLLTRRGDIKAAAARLAAAVDREELARLARYPAVELHGFVGTTAFGLDSLLSAPSRMLLAGASGMLPLYDHGRTAAGERAAAAGTAQAVAAYNQTVLDAVRETADALTRLAARAQEQRAADAVVADTQQLLSDAQRRRSAGLVDDRAVSQARIAATLAAVRADDLRWAVAQSRVSLIVAIGGSALDPSFLTASNPKVSP